MGMEQFEPPYGDVRVLQTSIAYTRVPYVAYARVRRVWKARTRAGNFEVMTYVRTRVRVFVQAWNIYDKNTIVGSYTAARGMFAERWFEKNSLLYISAGFHSFKYIEL